jgi:hypothetical protein
MKITSDKKNDRKNFFTMPAEEYKKWKALVKANQTNRADSRQENRP